MGEPTAEAVQSLNISAPAWFARADFVEWLNGKGEFQKGPPATWHQGGEPGEYSDVFTTYDHGDGPDSEDLPADIWETISKMAEDNGMEYGLIRISPI